MIGYWFMLRDPCSSKNHLRCSHAVCTIGPFKTRSVARQAREVYLSHRYTHAWGGLWKQTDRYERPFKTLAGTQRRFSPPIRYCYGHADGKRRDRSATHCGCGKRLPSAERKAAREAKRAAELRTLRAKIARLDGK